MTKEELKQEADESFEQYKVTDEDYVVSPYSDDMGEKMLMYNYEYYAEETYLRLYKQGYLAGAEPREKRIAELEQENAELKEKYAKECEDVCYVVTNYNNQLTKAKWFLSCIVNYEESAMPWAHKEMHKKTIAEVKDFLKESEVEK